MCLKAALVFKDHIFCYSLGTMRPKDQEMTTIKDIVCYSKFPGNRGHSMSYDTGPHGEALGLVRGRKGEGKARIKAFVVVFPYPWVSYL